MNRPNPMPLALNSPARLHFYVSLFVVLLVAIPAAAIDPNVSGALESVKPADTGNVIAVNVGTSKAIHTPEAVQRVAVGDPNIADVKVLEPNEILVLGKSAGSTDLLTWSEKGELRQSALIVEIDLGQLNEKLKKLFSGDSLLVTGSQGVYFVTGALQRADHVAQLRQFLEVSGLKYVDMTGLAGVQQVQIQVRVAEVNRTAIRKLGINGMYAGQKGFGGSLVGPDSGGAINPVSIGPAKSTPVAAKLPFVFTQDTAVSPLVSMLAGFPSHNLEFFIEALTENQYLRILAEPNLVAISGEEASFLSGGEFPIPIVQGSTVGGTAITIQYKEFGVRLRFRPTVLGDGAIRLHVAPEVSDLSEVGAVQIQGFSVPSLLTRKSETTVELKSGQTFAMAGLLNHTTNAINSRVPVLGELPVVGSGFRAVRHQQDVTELVILVTAQLMEPLSGADDKPVPGATEARPTDWELYLLGAIEGGNKSSQQAKDDPAHGDMQDLKKLQGPGGWATVTP